ncbi:MAG TPA: PTS sugar transporter subunit IIB, partial [Longimicrobiales bacterium]|nr:PTS sugar transporter subunit IIB [Longimicrobiales bacterium]
SIVVVDDELAASTWEQELYSMGLPDEMSTAFETVADARAHLVGWRDGSARVLLLTRDIGTMRRLAESGSMNGEEVIIGGIHYAPGREAVLPYVYLSKGELAEVNALESEGVRVSARDLPSSRKIDLKDALKGHEPGA